jgi:hypothetical protein
LTDRNTSDLGLVCRACHHRYQPSLLGRWRMELDAEQVCSWFCLERAFAKGLDALSPWGETTLSGMMDQNREHGHESLLDWCAAADRGA